MLTLCDSPIERFAVKWSRHIPEAYQCQSPQLPITDETRITDPCEVGVEVHFEFPSYPAAPTHALWISVHSLPRRTIFDGMILPYRPIRPDDLPSFLDYARSLPGPVGKMSSQRFFAPKLGRSNSIVATSKTRFIFGRTAGYTDRVSTCHWSLCPKGPAGEHGAPSRQKHPPKSPYVGFR